MPEHGRLLHLSDLHFGTEVPGAAPALLALAARLAPALAVLTGDLTQRATAAQFAETARFVRALPADRVLLLPGNHDLPLWAAWHRLWRPWRRWSQALGPWRPQALSHAGWHVVVADSVRRWRHRRGEIDAAERARVVDRLHEAAPGALRVVALHHPLVVRAPGEQAQRVIGADLAAAEWAGAGAALVLAGHVHDAFAQRLLLPPAPLWAVQAGTALSSRQRHGRRPSVQVLQRAEEGRSVWLQRWAYDAAAGAYVEAAVQRLSLHGRAIGDTGAAAWNPDAA